MADKPNHKIKDKLWNKEYLKVMASNFLLFFAFYLLAPLLPIYLDSEFGTAKNHIGLVLSGYVIATLLIRPFSGYFVDTFNRKKVLVICFFVFFICFTGYVGAGTLLMFAIVRTFHGIPFGATTVANSTVAIDVLPSSRRNEGISFYGLSNNLAMAIAPASGIYIYNLTHDFSLLFWISTVLSFIGFLFTTSIKLPYRKPVVGKAPLSHDHFFLTRAWLMAINIAFFGLCWGVMSNYVAIYGAEILGITGGTGVFFMILSIGLVLARLIGVKSLKEGKITAIGTRGVLLSSIGYLMFVLGNSEVTYYLSALFIGLGNGQMYPSFLNMFIDVARHDQRGTANSSILVSWDLGMGLGILIGGFLIELFNYKVAFLTVAGMQLMGTVLYLVATKAFYVKRKIQI